MNKLTFAAELGARLKGLPEREVEERIAFYLEAIDDRMEEGLGEAAAVRAVGTVDAVAAQIMAEIPLSAVVKARMRPRHRLSWWEVTLIVLGFPVWFSLLASLFAVLVSLLATLWSLVISAWATAVSLAAGGFGVLVAGVILLFVGEPIGALLMLSAALVSAGLAILAFFGAVAAGKGAAFVTARLPRWIKRCFVRRGI